MIPKEIRKTIINKPVRALGGQQTNGTPYTGVELEIESVGSVRVNWFRSKLRNYEVAMEMLEYLLLEAKII